VNDFNIVLSSVEGDHSNEVNDWFQHSLEFSWERSHKRGEWLISTLSWVHLREITQTRWMIDFNTVYLSSVEGDHSKPGEWFQHSFEFSWGRSLKPGEWFQHCLEFSWGDHSNKVSDFNIVLSSVEGYHSNEVNDFNLVLSSVAGDHSNEVNNWFQHCLEFSWGGSLKRGEWLISTLSWVQTTTKNSMSSVYPKNK
jgi:hypothetical protein